MNNQATRLSFVAALVAVVVLPALSGSWQLSLNAAIALTVLLLIALAVRGVNAQRHVLRQGVPDHRTLTKTIGSLEQIYFSLAVPVIGADPKSSTFAGTARAVQILARYGLTSIPMPSVDVEINARLLTLAQDPEFMSMLRSSATWGEHRWRESALLAGASLEKFADQFDAVQLDLQALAAAGDATSLVDRFFPAVTRMSALISQLASEGGASAEIR